MHEEFRDLYNRELRLLKEQAKEFADEYPGIAERLGGIVGDNSDPMVTGLLQGSAFLAARVQLKLKHEFPEFTANLLDQLLPNVLAPNPSCILAAVRPAFGDPALKDGRTIPSGSYLDATYVERERRVACRFQTRAPITLWPFELTKAEYLVGSGPFQAMRLPVGAEVEAGLRLGFTFRTTARAEDEPSEVDARETPELQIAGCRTAGLRLHLIGAEADATLLYEQLVARRASVFLRHLDAFGDPVAHRLPADCIRQIGFTDEEALHPIEPRLFRGFELLREFAAFPRKFLGIDLDGLKPILSTLAAKSFEIIVTFTQNQPRLAAAVKPGFFSLYAAPAINLFEKTTDRIAIKPQFHEYHVVPDRTQYLDFEPHRVLAVYAHLAGAGDKIEVRPLYSSAVDAAAARGPGMRYAIRRLPHRRSSLSRRLGVASDYVGTDLFISVSFPPDLTGDQRVAEISLKTLCSNRHLTEQLPTGAGGADFRFLSDVTLDVVCVAGPTRPREPIASARRSPGEGAGSIAWRLINMLAVNHVGLAEEAGGDAGAGLRDILSLFADPNDAAQERALRGVRSVATRPIVKRVSHRLGMAAARGIEVTVTLDEKAFEGSGVFHLGAVLDRFFAEYASLNHFTQTVIRSVDRGEIMRWPPRAGSRTPI